MVNLEKTFRDSVARAERELESICISKIHDLGISKTHIDLLGSHTVVTYPPLDSLIPLDGNNVFEKLAFQPEVDAYLHVPFCEYPCKFCPYTTLNLDGKNVQGMPSYFDMLNVEIGTWTYKLKKNNSKIRSLYLGGGTPFALPLNQLEDLLFFIKETLPFADSPEICVETSPKATLETDARRKLEILQKYGVNRISIGVQSFDFESLRDMARTFRGHDTQDEEKAVRILLNSGISNINVDMIQDLPLGSKTYLERLKFDLKKIASLMPQHVTWYNMRLRPEVTYTKIPKNIVNERESLLTRLTIWNFMESIGYKVQEGDRFVLEEKYEDTFRKTRGSVITDLLGIGVSAYSHVYPLFFQNPRVTGGAVRTDSKIATKTYVDAVKKNGHAITTGYFLSDDELLAGKFALGLKKKVDLKDVEEFLLGRPIAATYNDLILSRETKLVDAGLLEVSSDMKLGFTRTGRLFENEICARFYTPRSIYLAHAKRGTLTIEIIKNCTDYESAILMRNVMDEQRFVA